MAQTRPFPLRQAGLALVALVGLTSMLNAQEVQQKPVPPADSPAQTAPFVTPPVNPMTTREKFNWYVKHSLDAGSLLSPALPAGIIMAVPPKKYPREWRQGAQGFARNLGDGLATEESADMARFLVGTLNREDPRYFSDISPNPLHRTWHAIAFTFVDKSDNGHRRLALSNFAGAAAAGFVGRAYLPRGYNDLNHAEQRAAGAFGGYSPTLLIGYVTGNIFSEFSPELKRLGHALHIPFIPD